MTTTTITYVKTRKNKMTIVNATPHKITILANQNIEQDAKQQFLANPEAVEILTEIPPSGLIARVSITNYPVGDIDGIPLQSVIYGEIQGLPKYEKEVYYIVSNLVAQAASKIGRKDCLAPGALVRQKDNPSVILGCLFLQT